MKTNKIAAILVETAKCVGRGSDRFKRINGLTKEVVSKCREINPDAQILVPSHTHHNEQNYKLAVYRKYYGWNHRQIDDCDYDIIATV